MMRAIHVRFTAEDDARFLLLYPHTPNDEFMQMTGWDINQLKHTAKRLNCYKTIECRRMSGGLTQWPEENIQFIKDNYFKLTNRQLADALGLKLTIFRNKTRELGLKNYDLEYWTDEQADLLKANFRTMGDVEIAEILQQRWPRKRVWTKKHVKKKRDYLQLFRTRDEVKAIIKQHMQPGGKCDTIRTNSASTNLPDRYIANFITRDPQLKDELVKYPDLIELKRSHVKLNRAIKAVKS